MTKEDRVPHKILDFIIVIGLLIYVARTFKCMTLYLKGLYPTIDGWIEGRDKDFSEPEHSKEVVDGINFIDKRYIYISINV